MYHIIHDPSEYKLAYTIFKEEDSNLLYMKLDNHWQPTLPELLAYIPKDPPWDYGADDAWLECSIYTSDNIPTANTHPELLL